MRCFANGKRKAPEDLRRGTGGADCFAVLGNVGIDVSIDVALSRN